jgi:integrase
MASIETFNGYLYLKFYSKKKGYSLRKTLHVKATQANQREQERKLKKGELNHLFDTSPDGKKSPNGLQPHLYLSDILNTYFVSKNLTPGTRSIYNMAVTHLEAAAGRKYLHEYYEEDYTKLIIYFDQLPVYLIKKNELTGTKEKSLLRTGLSQNSKSMYARTLHALFKYLVGKNYIFQNIIGNIPQLKKEPRPIDQDDMKKILDELKKTNMEQFNVIYFIYNTGIRISTALALRWEDIDWSHNQIIFRNIKVQGKEFTFPLLPVLKEIFNNIGIKPRGKIFSYSNKDSMHFFNKVQETLKLEKHHSLHKMKATFISDYVNQGIPLKDLSLITNTDIKTLEKYYTKLDQKRIALQMLEIKRL